MQADSPMAVMKRLGEIEDRIALELDGYAKAAGFLAEFEKIERMLYLATKQQLSQEGLLDSAKTETAIKDRVEKFMLDNNAELYLQAREAAKAEAMGKVIFKGLDRSSSIGQSILGVHKEQASSERFGRGRPQGGGE